MNDTLEKITEALIIGGGAFFFLMAWLGNSAPVFAMAGAGNSTTPPAPAGNAVGNAPAYTGGRLAGDDVYRLALKMQALGLAPDPSDLYATAYIESAFNPQAQRYEPGLGDSSAGLMQVLTSTAMDLYNKGYTTYGPPSLQALMNPEIGMYFGAAYKDWLMRAYPGQTQEWYVRAYNGGPGNALANATEPYFEKWATARNAMPGLSSILLGV